MAKEFFTKDKVVFAEQPTRNNFLDLTGKVIDKLEVLGYAGKGGKGRGEWWCKCSCTEGRYFKVAQSSLKKNVTSSCGCNYKNNGKRARYARYNKTQASSALTYHLLFKEYLGWNHPCIINCTVCGENTEFKIANHARGFQCCKDIRVETINSKLKVFNFKYTGGRRASCNSCGLEVDYNKVSDFCGCKELPEGKDPCAVYFLKEDNKGLIKIGKALLPEDRKDTINKSASSVGLSFPVVTKKVWVNGEKAAYRLESMLHQRFRDLNVKNLPKFDGYNEVFQVSFKEIDTYLEEISESISRFVIEGYEPPLVSESTFSYILRISLEHEGVWYPSKASLLRVHNLTEYEYLTAIELGVKSYKKRRIITQVYGKDPRECKDYVEEGDFYKGSLYRILKSYGRKVEDFKEARVPLQEFLAKGYESEANKVFINGNFYMYKELADLSGVCPSLMNTRIKRGFSPQQAMTPLRFPSEDAPNKQGGDFIFLIQGQYYWWHDVSVICGYSEAIKVFTGRRGWVDTLKNTLKRKGYTLQDISETCTSTRSIL